MFLLQYIYLKCIAQYEIKNIVKLNSSFINLTNELCKAYQDFQVVG